MRTILSNFDFSLHLCRVFFPPLSARPEQKITFSDEVRRGQELPGKYFRSQTKTCFNCNLLLLLADGPFLIVDVRLSFLLLQTFVRRTFYEKRKIILFRNFQSCEYRKLTEVKNKRSNNAKRKKIIIVKFNVRAK